MCGYVASIASQSSSAMVGSYSPSPPTERTVKATNAISKLGNVVVTIAFTWSNNPVCAEAAARFVESDNGENLSPQHPPERMAPATRPGVTPIVVPIVINAMPSVALTVYAEPSESPTAAQRIVTAGRKIAGVKILSP